MDHRIWCRVVRIEDIFIFCFTQEGEVVAVSKTRDIEKAKFGDIISFFPRPFLNKPGIEFQRIPQPKYFAAAPKIIGVRPADYKNSPTEWKQQRETAIDRRLEVETRKGSDAKHTVVQAHFDGVTDADSFRQSEGQIMNRIANQVSKEAGRR